MGRSDLGARDGPACSAHLGTSALRYLVGHLKATVSRPLQKLSAYLPMIVAVCFVPKLASLVSTSPAPSHFFTWCILISLLGIKSIWCGLPNGFNLQLSHPRGRESTQLGGRVESPGPNMAFLSALRSCGIDLYPWIGPEQIGAVLDRNSHSASTLSDNPALATSSPTLPEPLRCNDAEVLLDLTTFEMAVPQVHATQFMRLESLDTEGDVLGTMVKGITHVQALAAHNHDGIPKVCPNTTDPIPSFTIPNRFDARSNVKTSERWIFAQLLCLVILSNLGPRCVQRKSFWATLQTMMKMSELPREPKKRSYFPIHPSRPPPFRSSPHRRAPRIGKTFVLGLLFLYALSSGTGSPGHFGFDDSGGSGQSPNDTNPGSHQENDIWPNYLPYFEMPILTHPGPEWTAGTDNIPGLLTHAQGATASTPHVPNDPPTPELINSRPTPPPRLGLHVHNQQGSAELYDGGASYTIPAQGYLDNTPFPQQSLAENYGVQMPHHPPAPQASFQTLGQMPPQPGAPNRTALYVPFPQARAPPLDTLQRPAADLARNPHQARSFQTSVPLGDVASHHLRQWVSTLGQPDPPLQPDLDERGQSAYMRGYADARRDLIAEILAEAQANPQLAQAEPSTHAQEESEVPVSLLPVAPTPQSNQVVSNPSPPTAAQEVSTKPGFEPYAPPTPPCDNTDPEPPSETLGAGTDPTIDSQAPHQESLPDAPDVDHHTPETIHAPQPVAPVPVASIPPQPPAPAPTSSLAQGAPYPSLPTPAATPFTQGGSSKPHICMICGKAYGRPYLLRDHITSKHSNSALAPTDKPYGCDFEGCNSRFSTRSNMRKHSNQKHRGSGTPHRNDTNQAGPSS